MHVKTINNLLIALLVFLWAVITAVKFLFMGYSFDSLIPRQAYDVQIETRANGYGSDLKITHFLPPTNELGQRVENEVIDAGLSNYTIDASDRNRKITYRFAQAFGPLQTKFSFRVRPREIRYTIPDYLSYPVEVPDYLKTYLKATKAVQSKDPVIERTARRLELYENENAVSIVRTIFDYVHKEIKPANFSGETDAVLTCKLGEASCNGKSRLMVALCRQMGIPARLVGGLILQQGSKRTTHQWLEVRLGEYWVPFCPLNGHFGVKPRNYLVAYRGDHAYFRHTKNIRFDYSFTASGRLVPKEQNMGSHKVLDIVNIWQVFKQAGIPLNLLRFVLIIPVGALVTILFRNVIGLQTFGTFLPALIASAFLGTGLLWGSLIFGGIISAGAALNYVLSKLRLLHTPKLTIIMVFVVFALLFSSMFGIKTGHSHLAQTFFFPLAVLTITIERFFIIGQERGTAKSFVILGTTMLVVAFCYMVMSSLFLQMAVVILPETYLLVLACSLYLGRWTGLRISELFRFRHIVFAPVRESRVPGGES